MVSKSVLDAAKQKIVGLVDIGNKWNDINAVKARFDELGKVVQTAEGAGTMEDPYKTWSEGTPVRAHEWWMTHDGYLWEALQDGTPSSSLDANFWDIPAGIIVG